MSKEQVKVSVTEVTITSEKKKNIRIPVDGTDILIPVDETVYAYFHEQFLRENPTPLQRKRYATITNILREAYLKGVKDGKSSK